MKPSAKTAFAVRFGASVIVFSFSGLLIVPRLGVAFLIQVTTHVPQSLAHIGNRIVNTLNRKYRSWKDHACPVSDGEWQTILRM
jgi:hypothetical protein